MIYLQIKKGTLKQPAKGWKISLAGLKKDRIASGNKGGAQDWEHIRIYNY